MDHLTRVQQALDYIETKLKQPLPIEQVARAAHYSIWHVQHVFGAIVGQGVKEYARRRRLTEAMRELATTTRSIIEIALDYQFESQESFTRAFSAQFAMTPGEARKQKVTCVVQRQQPRVTIEMLKLLQGASQMSESHLQPSYIEFPETKVVGLGTRFVSAMMPDANPKTVIAPLWDRFVKQIDAIGNRAGANCYGLVEAIDPIAQPPAGSGEFFYIACVAVNDFSAAPREMLQRTIPAGCYAVFVHKGPLDGVLQTMKAIYGGWLPKSGVDLRSAPHLERYDHRFVPGSAQSEFDILLPVK